MQELLPILAGAPPGQMRGSREGVYPQRYSTDRGTKQMARCRPAPQGGGLWLAGFVALGHRPLRVCSLVAPRQRAKSPPAKPELIFAQTLSEGSPQTKSRTHRHEKSHRVSPRPLPRLTPQPAFLAARQSRNQRDGRLVRLWCRRMRRSPRCGGAAAQRSGDPRMKKVTEQQGCTNRARAVECNSLSLGERAGVRGNVVPVRPRCTIALRCV